MATVSKGVFRAAVSEVRELHHQLNIRDCKIAELEAEIDMLKNDMKIAMEGAKQYGYSAGYAARDKLCLSHHIVDTNKKEPK